jgi:hypothetical protein
MKKLILIPILFFLPITFAQVTEEPSEADYQAMSDALKSPQGLALLVHGADSDNDSYVLTWRDKKNFFKYAELPMTGRNPDAQKAIESVHRNDGVRVWGEFDLFLPVGQRHLDIDRLVIEKPFYSACEALKLPPYKHSTKIPDDLAGKSEITALVHGVANGGSSFVVQYGDANVPVIAPEPSRVSDLFKGDIVKLQFTIVQPPGAPAHLKLKAGADAVQMVQSVQDVNPKSDQDQNRVRCGALVLYKESPNINSNVFAVKMDQPGGYEWTFTLFNVDRQAFEKIRDKVQAVWDAHVSTAQCGRNYVWNPHLVICAKGPGNESDASQANPQIMVNSPDDVTIEVK